MTRDLAVADFARETVFDVCVVGAGASGILLTLQLLRAGKRVALVESGGLEFEQATQELYRTQVAGQPHTGVHEGRFRTWGGTTTRWGGQILELEPIDFAERDWVPGSGWPIAKDELVEAYRAALTLEGVDSALQNDADVWKAGGSSVPQLGPDLEPYVTRWCPQPNFAKLHGKELADAKELTALLHANVVDVVFEPGMLQAIVCRSLNGNTAQIAAREFVFCIGSIETSRLLLHLEEKHGAAWNPNGMVGQGFHDHIDCEALAVVPTDRKRFRDAFTNVLFKGYKYHPKFRLSAAQQQAYEVLNVAGTITFRDSSEEAAASVKATGKRILRRSWNELDGAQVVSLVRNLPLLVKQAWAYVVQHRVYNSPDAEIAMRVHCEQQPLGQSNVALADTRDALGMRQAKLTWVISELELKTIRVFADAVAKGFAACGLASVRPLVKLDDDAALRKACDDGLHHMGGAVMSADATQGVVDVNLRLHGWENVSVCSAAVFPTGGFSNPTHTLLALTARLAQRLTHAGGE